MHKFYAQDNTGQMILLHEDLDLLPGSVSKGMTVTIDDESYFVVSTDLTLSTKKPEEKRVEVKMIREDGGALTGDA